MSFPAADILIAYSFLVQKYLIKDIYLLNVVAAVISCLFRAAYFIYQEYKPKKIQFKRTDIVVHQHNYNHPKNMLVGK